tara:strand:- start:472 stop:726 length:255 start_codon:yes stop_codon:yes gene_type:complete
MSELYKFAKKGITFKNCSSDQGMKLFNLLTQKDFHRFNSHGGWIEFNRISYFCTVNISSVDKIVIESANKLLDCNERMHYKFIK